MPIQIKLKLDDDSEEIVLTPEQARDIYAQLDIIFGKQPMLPYVPAPAQPMAPYQPPIWPNPLQPWITWTSDHIQTLINATVADGSAHASHGSIATGSMQLSVRNSNEGQWLSNAQLFADVTPET